MLTLLFIFFAQPAWAVLGEASSSIDLKDRPLLFSEQTQTKMSSNPNYSVHQISASCTKINEYVSNSGTVFAVTWTSCRFHPDLTVLLGAYYSEYISVDKNNPPPPGRAPAQVTTPNIVVVRGGSFGHLQGLAYIPDYLPQGVTRQDLK